jgi:hypothetical protein
MIEKDHSFPLNNNTCVRVSDIAKAYLPDYKKTQSATRMLRKRIRESRMLYEKLMEADYNEKSMFLTPIQVELIYRYWGKPDAYKAKHAKD